MPKSEGDIQREGMIAMQIEWPDALILRQNTGAATDLQGNFIKFGTPGQADVRSVIDGLAIEVEFKTPTGTQSSSQKNYQAAYERAGGIYVLARSATEAVETIKWKISMKNSPQQCGGTE